MAHTLRPGRLRRFNRSSPFARGLSLCTVPGDSGNQRVLEQVSGQACGVNPSDSAANYSVAHGRHGRGLKNLATLNLGYTLPTSPAKMSSFLFVGAVLQENNRGPFIATANDAYFGILSTMQVGMMAYSGGWSLAGATTLSVGQVVTGGGRWKSYDHAVFLNGRKDGSSASMFGDDFGYGTAHILGVGIAGYGTHALAMWLGLSWSRALTDGELSDITGDPWQLFRRSIPRTYFFPSPVPMRRMSLYHQLRAN